MKKSMKNLIMLIIVLAIIASAGCSAGKHSNVDLGVVIYRYDDNYMSFVKKGIYQYSVEELNLDLNDSENSQEIQNQQVSSLIEKKVEVLAVNVVEPHRASEVLLLAKTNHVPIIFFNREPEKSVLDSYDQCWYVGTDSKEAGIIQGDLVASSWKAHPQWDLNNDHILQCVILKGEEGHNDAELRTEYVISTLVSQNIQIEILDIQAAEWDSLKAKGVMDNWLNELSGIEYVIANNDAMALGALASLQNHGYFDGTTVMPIVGVDGIPEILSKIDNGIIVGTVLNDSKAQAKAIVDIAMNIKAGNTITHGTELLSDDGKAIRIPYIKVTAENTDIARNSYAYDKP